MISATNISNYNGAAVGLSETPETKTTTTQATTTTGTNSISPSIELAAAVTTPDITQTTPSLAQMLDSVTTMLQNLMKMIQNLLVSSDSSNRPPSGTQGGNVGAPPEEPPTIIPVTPPNTTQQPSTTAPTNNQTTQSRDTTTTKDTGATTPTREVRGRRRKGAKKSKSGTSSINGRGQFLWKPKSEKDGKLAILLPKQYTGNVASVEVISPDGKQKLAEGKASGVGNGDREHFRFNAPGEAFPDGSIVLVTLRDGSKREVEIKNTSARLTR
jgi:hypothetical protein